MDLCLSNKAGTLYGSNVVLWRWIFFKVTMLSQKYDKNMKMDEIFGDLTIIGYKSVLDLL